MQIVNKVNETPSARAVMDKVLGVAKEAALPTESTESSEQIERREFSDQSDHTPSSVVRLTDPSHEGSIRRQR